MNKALKAVLISLLVLVLLFAAFTAAWMLWLYRYFIPEENIGGGSELNFTEIAENSETIDLNEDTGLLYVNNELIIFVRVSATPEQIDAVFDGLNAQIDETMADIGVYKLKFDTPMTYDELDELIVKVKSNAIVENAYFNTITPFDADSVGTAGEVEYRDPIYPIDSWAGSSWNVDVPRGNNWGMEAINAPGAWAYLDEMSEVNVGLIDLMPDLSHEDLEFANHSCIFIDNNGSTSTNTHSVAAENHGSHVAGTIGATWGNGKGVSGVMGDRANLYYCNIYYSNSDGSFSTRYGDSYSYLLALKTLIDQDVQVINISLNTSRLIGFAASHGNQNAINYLTNQAELTEQGLKRIIEQRQEAGKPDFVICVAAGNSNNIYYYKDDSAPYGYRETLTESEKLTYPYSQKGERGGSLALYNNFLNLMDDEEVMGRVIVVGALKIDSGSSTSTNTMYSYASFSNVGSRVDIVAPGYDIYSSIATRNGNYSLLSGTSMATPHVTGVAGLIFACNPTLSGPEVKAILTSSTVGRYYYMDGYSGLVNASAAVNTALRTRDESVNHVLGNESDALDLCFVVDTTGSMGDDIDNAKENMENILVHLAEKTQNYRVALVDYRDFSSRSNRSYDYPYKVELDFTNDNDAITNAIRDLTLGNGGDTNETVYSGLMAAVGLNWRQDAKKAIIVLGDAPPLDPEPETGYTYDDVLLAMFNADIGLDYDNSDGRVLEAPEDYLINVFTIDAGTDSSAADFFQDISESTGGSYANVDDASGVSDAIIDSIEQIKVAERVTVDADFGKEMADQCIYLYSEDGFMFSIETDENGEALIEAIEPNKYTWTYNGIYAGGTLDIESGESEASVRKSREYKLTSALRFWQESKNTAILVSFGIILLCIFIPIVMHYILKSVRGNKTRKKQTPAANVIRPASAVAPKAEPIQTENITYKAESEAVTQSVLAESEADTAQAEPAVENVPQEAAMEPPQSEPVVDADMTSSERRCPSCGAVVNSGKFCSNCGAKLENEEESINS